MAANGWQGAKAWKERANEIAPTIVGGSTKHGGPDLGPTRARRAWAALRRGRAYYREEPPACDFVGMSWLTVRMVARLQGFPDDWKFAGKKTNAYRQVVKPAATLIVTNLGLCTLRAKDKGTCEC